MTLSVKGVNSVKGVKPPNFVSLNSDHSGLLKRPPIISNNTASTSTNFRNLYGTTEKMGYIKSCLYVFSLDQPLLNGDNSGVLKRTPPTSNIAAFTTTNFRNLHETTKVMDYEVVFLCFSFEQHLVNGEHSGILKAPLQPQIMRLLQPQMFKNCTKHLRQWVL